MSEITVPLDKSIDSIGKFVNSMNNVSGWGFFVAVVLILLIGAILIIITRLFTHPHKKETKTFVLKLEHEEKKIGKPPGSTKKIKRKSGNRKK